MITFDHRGGTFTLIKPAKSLFRSNMVHDVMTRGDVFALNISTRVFTIISRADYEHSLRKEQ